MDLSLAVGLGVAALGGAAVGLERQWSGHASGPQARFGGIRTFTLLGGLGGLAGLFAVSGLLPLAVVVLVGSTAMVVSAYIAASRSDIDATTEVAAIVVLAAGTLSGAGHLALASAVVAATAVLLLEKSRLHTLVAGIDDAALRASARFAALACIVLPLLPPGPFGPLDAIRPRELWLVVLFFSGLSFLGWIARRLVGPHRGVIVSGLLGGVVSSTSVAFNFARESRGHDAPRVALAAGVIGACTVMLLRVTIASAVLNPALAAALPPFLGLAFMVGVIAVLAGWRANGSEPLNGTFSESPLQLKSALQMTAMFQVVLFVILAVRARWSSEALVATSALVGLTDLDALTLSLARSTTEPGVVPTAAFALAAGVFSNTVLKLAVAVAIGRGWFRAVTAGGLGAMGMALAAAMWFAR